MVLGQTIYDKAPVKGLVTCNMLYLGGGSQAGTCAPVCASSRLNVGELKRVLLLSYGRVGKDKEKFWVIGLKGVQQPLYFKRH